MALAALLVIACERPRGWVAFEGAYSRYLTSTSSGYAAVSGQNAFRTVGVVQVFNGTVRGATDASAFLNSELVYETRDPAQIEALFVAAQQSLPSDPQIRDCRSDDTQAFTVIAYDSQLPRAAMIRLYPCMVRSELILIVRPFGGIGLSYSRALARYLRAKFMIPKSWGR